MSILEKESSFVPSWAKDIPNGFRLTTEGPLPKEEVYIPSQRGVAKVIEIPVGIGYIPMPTGGYDILLLDYANGEVEKSIALLPKIDPSFQQVAGLFLEAMVDDNLADEMGADLWEDIPQLRVGRQGIEFSPQLEEPEDEEDNYELPIFTLNSQGFTLHPDLNPDNLAIQPGIWYHTNKGDFLIEHNEDQFYFNFVYATFEMEDPSDIGESAEYKLIARLSVRNTDYLKIQAEINDNLLAKTFDEGNLRQFVDYQVVAQKIPS